MSFTHPVAAQTLRELREERGLSPEQLAQDIRRAALTAPWGNRGCVDAHTIRRIEKYEHLPSLRVRFVLAHYFGVDMRVMWDPKFKRPMVERVAA